MGVISLGPSAGNQWFTCRCRRVASMILFGKFAITTLPRKPSQQLSPPQAEGWCTHVLMYHPYAYEYQSVVLCFKYQIPVDSWLDSRLMFQLPGWPGFLDREIWQFIHFWFLASNVAGWLEISHITWFFKQFDIYNSSPASTIDEHLHIFVCCALGHVWSQSTAWHAGPQASVWRMEFHDWDTQGQNMLDIFVFLF